MIALADFLLARIAEDEAVAEATSPFDDDDDIAAEEWHEREELWDAQPHSARCGWRRGEGLSSDCTCGYPAHVLAECEAKRRIIALYEDWPVFVDVPETVKFATEISYDTVSYRISRQMGWLTTREYVERFGTEPPTGPILLALAEVYSDHPDYREATQ